MKNFDWKEFWKGRRIFIWGASIGGEQAFECLARYEIDIEAFCDNDEKKQKSLFCKKPVISPISLKNEVVEGDCVVILASFAFESIYKQMLEMGLKCDTYVYLLYDPCHLKNGAFYTETEKEEIRQLYDSEQYTAQLLNLILNKGFLNSDTFDKIEELRGFGGIDAYYYDASIADKVMSGGGI